MSKKRKVPVTDEEKMIGFLETALPKEEHGKIPKVVKKELAKRKTSKDTQFNG